MNGTALAILGTLATAGAVLSTGAAVRSRSGQLVRTRFSAKTSGRLRRTGFLPLAFVGVALTALSAPKTLIIVLPLGFVALHALRSHRLHRQHRRYEASIPDALDAITRSIRSGAGLQVALFEASRNVDGPIADDLSHVVTEARLGHTTATALRNWGIRRPYKGVRLATASMSLALESGVAHGQVTEKVNVSVRQALKAAENANTHATQSKASAMALTLMPVLFTGPLALFDPAVREFLFQTWTGVVILGVGLLLDAAGALWMSHLIRRSLR